MADSDYNGGPLVAIIALFLTLTCISVLLRFYVRLWITKAFQWDDWFMLAAQINFIVDCVLLCAGVHYGLGRHNDTLPLADQIAALKYQALATLGYVSNMAFIKFSIAFFLLRIAVERRYTWILRISMVIVAIWSVAIFIYYIFECVPIAAQWDFTIKDAKCVPDDSFAQAAYSISVMTILTDWLYALLPIPMIWNVQMSSQTKITVILILSLGVFASIATIIRLKYIVNLVDTSDVLFGGTTAMIWTLVEPGVAITASSLVTIRPLLRYINLPGFNSTDLGYPAGVVGGRATFGRGHPKPRQDPNILSLRNDVLEDHWTSTVDCEGKDIQMVRKASKGGFNTREEDIGMGGGGGGGFHHGDGGSEEFILGFTHGIGVKRTVDISVEHDQARERTG